MKGKCSLIRASAFYRDTWFNAFSASMNKWSRSGWSSRLPCGVYNLLGSTLRAPVLETFEVKILNDSPSFLVESCWFLEGVGQEQNRYQPSNHEAHTGRISSSFVGRAISLFFKGITRLHYIQRQLHNIHNLHTRLHDFFFLKIMLSNRYSCNQSPAQPLWRSRRSPLIFARISRSCVRWSLAPSNVAGWTSGWTSNTSIGQWTGSGGHGRLVPGRWRRKAEFHDAFDQLSRK